MLLIKLEASYTLNTQFRRLVLLAFNVREKKKTLQMQWTLSSDSVVLTKFNK